MIHFPIGTCNKNKSLSAFELKKTPKITLLESNKITKQKQKENKQIFGEWQNSEWILTQNTLAFKWTGLQSSCVAETFLILLRVTRCSARITRTDWGCLYTVRCGNQVFKGINCHCQIQIQFMGETNMQQEYTLNSKT